MLTFILAPNYIKIIDSFTVSKRSEMKGYLQWIKEQYPDNKVMAKRSITNLVQEWRSHNLLYKLNIKRERTKDVDLDIPQKWYYKFSYFILSILYL